MRAAVICGAIASIAAADPTAGRFSDVEGGRKHDITGLVCPVTAGRFQLKSTQEGEGAFQCRYTLRCRAAEGCTAAIGFATVSWDPKRDMPAAFRALSTQNGLTSGDEPGPAWAGTPRMFASAGTGANASHAGWWRITSNGHPLDIGVVYNVAAEEDANALVGLTAFANP